MKLPVPRFVTDIARGFVCNLLGHPKKYEPQIDTFICLCAARRGPGFEQCGFEKTDTGWVRPGVDIRDVEKLTELASEEREAA